MSSGSSQITFHPHAVARMAERGAIEPEVVATVRNGERFPVRFGRQGFRHHFHFDAIWRGRHYLTKQIEAIAVDEDGGWLVISVIVKYF
jgi:hypothetical protein